MPSSTARSAAVDGLVDRQALDAGHRRHRLAHLVAVDEEDRPDQVVDRQRRFAHQPPRPVGAAVAPHAAPAEDRVHVGLVRRVGGEKRGAFAGPCAAIALMLIGANHIIFRPASGQLGELAGG